MRYIPLKESGKKALDVWLDKSNQILEEMKNEPDAEARRQVIEKNKSHWRNPELLKFLNELSDGKCWYTETRFSAEYEHIEHFRPKRCACNEKGEQCHDGYWWLAFDVENYRLSKPMPNVRKGTYFPLQERVMAVQSVGIALSRETPMLIDPADEEDTALIGFNSHGKPEPCSHPAADLTAWDIQRVEFSIARYGLDDKTLCDSRKELWVSIQSLMSEYMELIKKHKAESCKVSQGQAKEKLIQLKAYLEPSYEFTALVRDCFQSSEVGQRIYSRLTMMKQAA